ncbi:hypothetical protein ASG25_21130 [Rhizobium sp. Leaf384]|uniref:hypothetical protein n=1 Tax=unclassified Rhizobium TaxID=2613769 RepID=UPI000713D05C|nr:MULTISPECIES: hypothetical protein [unclassified Rhizobium]KQS74302.1 hypothetical protein ASG25_21130 [Rhizobium sp. Leaf384]KQS83945.1 hypothetical protein ASG58_21510 [Rhizobium sp. Leaf383]
MITPDFLRIQLVDLRTRHPDAFDNARYVDVGVGWVPLVEDFLVSSPTSVDELKQKYGRLRISCSGDTDAVWLAHVLAEERSAHRCEVCGNPGFIRRPPPPLWSWWQCRCDEHASSDQLAWPRHPSVDVHPVRQIAGRWYQYDPVADLLVEVELPERWK